MRRFLKGLPFKKVFVSLFVSLYTFLPSLQAFGVVIEDYAYASEDVSVGVDESEDILNEGISDPEWIAKPISTYEDGVYTVHSVDIGEYVYPDNEDVRVEFTSITEEGDLVIKKVELTEEEKELLNTSEDYGWDITSSMSNGSFTYDLTLPNSTESNDVEVKYSEDGNTYESIDDVIVNENVIEIKGLEHFSIYIVSSILPVKLSPAPVQVETEVSCDITVPTDVESIQNAIEKSKESGERLTICVKQGVYEEENLIINHPVRLVALLDDPSKEEAVIIGKNEKNPAIYIINTTNVEINGLTIVKNNSEKGGILIDNSSECVLINNRFLNNQIGLILSGKSKENKIGRNIFAKNQKQVVIYNNEEILKTILGLNEFDGSIIVRSQTTSISSTIFGTVQVAVNSAGDKDTLDIYDGTYNETVTINKPLTLIGVEEKQPIIHGGFTVDTEGSVNVNNLKFRVPKSNPVDSIHIKNVEKLSVKKSNFNGSNLFVGGAARGIVSDDSNATVTVENCNFNDGYYTAIQGEYKQLNINETNISNCKSGINFQSGGNLVVKNTNISVIAQGGNNDTYAVRFASPSAGSGQDMILDGGKYSVNKNGYTADSGIYHSAIVVRSGANGNLNANNLSLNGDVVNLSGKNLNATHNWWGDASGPQNPTTNPAGKGNAVSDNVDYRPWYKNAEMTISSDTKPSTPTGLTAKFQYDSQNLENGGTINITAKPNNNNLVLLWQPNPIDLVTGYRIYGKFPDNTTKLSYQGPNTNAWLKAYNDFGAHGNGKYTYQVIAVNANGESSPSEPFVIYYDTQGPTATLTSAPANNSYVKGDFNVAGTAQDNVALKSVFFDVRTQNGWVSGCKSGTTYLTYSNDNKNADISCIIDTRNLVNGTTYMLRIHAGDNAGYGNVNPEAVRYFTMDTEEPTVSFAGLRHYDYRHPSTPVDTTNTSTSDNTPIVLISASDSLSGMSSVTVNEQTATYDGSKYWIVELATLPEGAKTLEIVGTDKAGNTTTISQDIFIDTFAPTAIYKHYNNGVLIDETTNPITYVKGINQLSFTAEYTDTEPSSGLLQDSYVIFQAQDDGSFRFSANDKKAYCSWRKSPNLVTQLTGSKYSLTDKIQFTNCIDLLPDGEYYMAHQVYDSATKKDIPTINQFRDVLGLHFVVDTQAPITPTAMLTANNLSVLTNGYTSSETFTFNLSSSEDTTRYQLKYWNNIQGSQYKEDSPWGLTDIEIAGYMDPFGSYNDKFTQGEGKHYFAFSACDAAGNCSEYSDPFVVTYDHTEPTSTITSPSSDYITKEKPEIIGYTEDIYSVDKVVLSYTDYDTDTQQCGTGWEELTTIINDDKELLPFDWSYSEWNLEEGAYCIKAQGIDLAGNEEHTAIIENLVYDTTPPEVLLNLVLGVLNITAEDLLSGIYTIQVSTDNIKWQDYILGTDINLNDLVGNQPGTHTVYVRVTDKAGNLAKDSVTFSIPSPTPTTTETAGEILGITSPLKPTPVKAYSPTPLGTGGYLLSQIDEQNTEEEETTKEETTLDSPEIKGEEDNNGEPTEQEQTPEQETTKWWVYPLVILPVLAIFLILWKRRKEDNEPQF